MVRRSRFDNTVGAIQIAKRKNNCEQPFMCPEFGCNKEVCRPRKFIEHYELYHQQTRRWFCSPCKKFFQLHSEWSKHCHFWHDQPQYVSATYVTSLYNAEAGDTCEETFIKADAVAEKRRLTGQTGGPSRKKRKVASESSAVKATLTDEGMTAKDIVNCVMNEVLAGSGCPVMF